MTAVVSPVAAKNGAKRSKSRISLACDQCNHGKSKCNGEHPCSTCLDRGIDCEYARPRKKRGKPRGLPPRRDSEVSASNALATGSLLPPLSDVTQQKSYMPGHAHGHGHNSPMLVYGGFSPLSRPAFSPHGPMSHDLHNSQSPPIGSVMLPYGAQPPPNQRSPSSQSPHSASTDRPPLPWPQPSNNGYYYVPAIPQTYPTWTHGSTRYPVLKPLFETLPISIDLAEALLEEYFDSSPYVIGYCIRRCKFLSPTAPRTTNTCLVYCLLWIGSLTCHHVDLTTPASKRAIVSQQLMNLCTQHLSPLGQENHSLDDIITYLCLGIVGSTTESKGNSLQWLHVAFGLARQNRLHDEIDGVDEDYKEERRRTWWSCYSFDRHVALSFNRPLALFNFDCLETYHPCDEMLWKSDADLPPVDPATRCRGSTAKIQSSGFYGFFIPLMNILGNILEMHHNSKHANLDYGSQTSIKEQITAQLRDCQKSLEFWRTQDTSTPWAYYTEHNLHTLYLLLHGHMDIISMIEDTGDWISSSDFVIATEHAVSAADALANILLQDPDLSFMPLPFGIFLFQGSFPLVLIIDKLEKNVTPDIMNACEIIVRALEVCIVAMDNQYLRNFRIVLRGCLERAKHTGPSDPERDEHAKQRRKKLLAMYRWSRDGRGIIV